MNKNTSTPEPKTAEQPSTGEGFSESDYSPRPRPEDFGYEAMDGFGEHGSGGWQFEGGEEAYDTAMAAWEKANASDHGLSPVKPEPQ